MNLQTNTTPEHPFSPSTRTIVGACEAALPGLVLIDGTPLRFRPIDGHDRAGLADLFARLSPESRRRRFLSPKAELTRRELAFLTEIDHMRHDAIAAVDQRDGMIAGVGRYVRLRDHARGAEVAIEVADERQNMGLGTELANWVVCRARANGFELLTARTLWENRPAHALLRRLGFRATASHGSELELELVIGPRESEVAG